jgi:outer membrane translocation and assembly module TamA
MTGGEPVPLHYRFFVGGENSYAVFQGDRTSSFHGYRHQELAGRHAFTAEVGLQIEPFPGWYLSIAGNAGNAVDDRGDLFRSSMISSGGAVSIGAETPAGPVEFLVSYSERNHFSFFLNAGFPF